MIRAFFRQIFPVGHTIISLLFIACAFALVFYAVLQLWQGIQPWAVVSLYDRLNAILESIALLTVSVAALELGQTILEEEVQRKAHMSGPPECAAFCLALWLCWSCRCRSRR